LSGAVFDFRPSFERHGIVLQIKHTDYVRLERFQIRARALKPTVPPVQEN